MIDHVSVPVRDLDRAVVFYESLLHPIGYLLRIRRERGAGFGKTYPELWLNLRDGKAARATRKGFHVALRCRGPELVDAFHSAGLAAGGLSDGPPGPRHGYSTPDRIAYAAFIRDPDGNRIEAVTFLPMERAQEQ